MNDLSENVSLVEGYQGTEIHGRANQEKRKHSNKKHICIVFYESKRSRNFVEIVIFVIFLFNVILNVTNLSK